MDDWIGGGGGSFGDDMLLNAITKIHTNAVGYVIYERKVTQIQLMVTVRYFIGKQKKKRKQNK